MALHWGHHYTAQNANNHWHPITGRLRFRLEKLLPY